MAEVRKLAARLRGSTVDPCCCNPPVVLECKSRGGTATLIGVDENPGFVSTPPKKYKGVSASSTTTCTFTPWYGQQTDTRTASGVSQMDESGNWSSLIKEVMDSSGSSQPHQEWDVIRAYTHGLLTPSHTSPWFFQDATHLYNSFRRGYLSGTTAPYYDYYNNPAQPASQDDGITTFLNNNNNVWYYSTGQIDEVLSDEDTETEAEARSGADWSGWAKAANCTHCCLASRTVRSTGFSFTFQASKYRLGCPTGVSGQSYPVLVDIERRLIGTSEWILVATLKVYVTAYPDPEVTPVVEPPVSHNVWPEYDVPQLSGYETRVTNARHEPQA